MVILSPVYAATALAIKADDPGPALFKQKRVGQNKQYFELLKFRSMSVNTPNLLFIKGEKMAKTA